MSTSVSSPGLLANKCSFPLTFCCKYCTHKLFNNEKNWKLILKRILKLVVLNQNQRVFWPSNIYTQPSSLRIWNPNFSKDKASERPAIFHNGAKDKAISLTCCYLCVDKKNFKDFYGLNLPMSRNHKKLQTMSHNVNFFVQKEICNFKSVIFENIRWKQNLRFTLWKS